ncbi:helix-turn-helix domain-containing protein [Streptomyces montanisoli]|nr:helix-turn-helix domain-containing protein [Streptomyces montanisoli]
MPCRITAGRPHQIVHSPDSDPARQQLAVRLRRAVGGRTEHPLLGQRLPRRHVMRNQSKPAVEAAFLNVQTAAQYMGISVNTLYVWRHRRQGPPSFRMGPGGRVMYRRDLLDAWLREQQRADSRSNPALNPLNKAPQQRERRRAS